MIQDLVLVRVPRYIKEISGHHGFNRFSPDDILNLTFANMENPTNVHFTDVTKIYTDSLASEQPSPVKFYDMSSV